jgi:hypothetical protein
MDAANRELDRRERRHHRRARDVARDDDAMQAASLVASNDGAIVVAFRGALTGATRPEADSSSAVVEIWRAGDSNAPTRMVTPVATHPSEESAEPSFDGERRVRKFAKDQLAKRYGFDRDAEAGSRSSTIRLATS